MGFRAHRVHTTCSRSREEDRRASRLCDRQMGFQAQLTGRGSAFLLLTGWGAPVKRERG